MASNTGTPTTRDSRSSAHSAPAGERASPEAAKPPCGFKVCASPSAALAYTRQVDSGSRVELHTVIRSSAAFSCPVAASVPCPSKHGSEPLAHAHTPHMTVGNSPLYHPCAATTAYTWFAVGPASSSSSQSTPSTAALTRCGAPGTNFVSLMSHRAPLRCACAPAAAPAIARPPRRSTRRSASNRLPTSPASATAASCGEEELGLNVVFILPSLPSAMAYTPLPADRHPLCPAPAATTFAPLALAQPACTCVPVRKGGTFTHHVEYATSLTPAERMSAEGCRNMMSKQIMSPIRTPNDESNHGAPPEAVPGSNAGS
mmetsp:Transcript_10822/g.41971  ORF Transcript_10822/g.41971 Transcript_10822/m.41971 type:complete len:316 (-) Transcript_10822:498-1445(-)